MDDITSNLKTMMRLEVADKGRAAGVAFFLVAVWTLIYSSNVVVFKSPIRFLAVFILVLSVHRFLTAAESKPSQVLTDSKYNLIRMNVWANAFCWSLIFTLASLEFNFTGIHFIITTAVICGFISSSLITLSPDVTLFLPLQLLMIGPQTLIILYDSLTENQYKLAPMIGIYLIGFYYQLRQGRAYRMKLIQSFKLQLELKKRNLELQESQEAQTEQTIKLIHTSRLAALGEMAAGIAHEVNNPLAIISGSLQQLERKILRKEFDDVDLLKKHTDRSQLSIERITKIIHGLRLFSQQSDSLPKIKGSLIEIVNDTLSFCGEMLKARYVRLDVAAIPDVSILCQPVQISQVLINLIKNAEDALAEERSENDRWVKISFELTSQMVFINVTNGGKKIPHELYGRLFVPFFTTKGVGKGTGLGLSISKGIMVEHGGDLILNEAEIQTTFTFSLPIYREARA